MSLIEWPRFGIVGPGLDVIQVQARVRCYTHTLHSTGTNVLLVNTARMRILMEPRPSLHTDGPIEVVETQVRTVSSQTRDSEEAKRSSYSHPDV